MVGQGGGLGGAASESGVCAVTYMGKTGFLSDVRGTVASKQECFDLCEARSQCSGVSYHDDWKSCELDARNFDELVAQGIPSGWTTSKGECEKDCTIQVSADNGFGFGEECFKKVTGAQVQYFKDATCNVPWGNRGYSFDQCEQNSEPWGGSVVGFAGCSETPGAPRYLSCGGCFGPADETAQDVANCWKTLSSGNFEAVGEVTCMGATYDNECVKIIDSGGITVYATLKPISASTTQIDASSADYVLPASMLFVTGAAFLALW